MSMIQRPSPEIERRLRNLETDVKGINSPIKHNGDSWVPTTEILYVAYASALTNLGVDGSIPNQSDATDFGFQPFSDTGDLLAFRGRLVSTSIYASGDATDYTWESTSTTVGSSSYIRYYSEDDALAVNLGDPDSPGAGITWISISPATSIPSSAFWIADKYTIDGVESAWQIYPVKTGVSSNIGIISYTKTGSNKPVLNDTVWQADVLIAATAFTGLSYSSHTELGHGATVVITYDDGKLYGTLKEVASVNTWVVADSFVDGDLVVDGTITTDQIAANTITASNISAGTITGTEVTLAPSDVGAGTSASSGSRMNITSDKIEIYSVDQLTGTIDPTASTAVVGIGTLFLTEISVSDQLIVSGETRVVTVITDDTNLTVSTAFSDNANDTSPEKVTLRVKIGNLS